MRERNNLLMQFYSSAIWNVGPTEDINLDQIPWGKPLRKLQNDSTPATNYFADLMTYFIQIHQSIKIGQTPL